ncbi:hypothetical protein JG688_00009890 [Phytophthora aleatoria]|uniref:Uncharacterized protein n=1 Tax=Phytophthora aleatoria TaxID=2496075 RepID=A0A8J5IT50_9STRA|nr:hypothetical protein JG688_00009890 [Phytophthora aleatoria]
MSGVTQAVKRTIAEELPSHFGVMFDGVTHASEHYVAWHGSALERAERRPFRTNSPRFLATMLPRDYGVQIEQCRFLVGDNCAVNRLLATLMGVPLQYLRLLELLDADDDDLMEVILTPAANKRLRALFKELKDIESVSKAHQGRDVDLLDVLTSSLPSSHSMNIPRRAMCEFCAAGKIRLTRAEKAALLPFAKPVETEANQGNEDGNLSFALSTRK